MKIASNFLRFFPEIDLPDEKDPDSGRSACLRIGAFLVLRRIIAEYKLEDIIGMIIA